MAKKKKETSQRSKARLSPFSNKDRSLRSATATAAAAECDLYFAYGSNMNRDQMSNRCPRAEFVGPAVLKNWKLTARGVADIDIKEGKEVYGAIWKVTPDCFVALDRYEGFPSFYDREVFQIELSGVGMVFAWSYVMADHHKNHEASMAFNYAMGCAEGARQSGAKVDPLYIRDIAHGSFEKAIRPWTSAKDRQVVKVEVKKRKKKKDVPDFVAEEIAEWCREKGISESKVSNFLAFATYNKNRREIRVSGGGNYFTIREVGPPIQLELDTIEEAAGDLLVADDSLLEEVEAMAFHFDRDDEHFVASCRQRVSFDGRTLDADQRSRLKGFLE